MQFINRALFDNAGVVTEIQSVGRDITERKQMEEALLESNLRWKFALEGSEDGVWDWDIEKGTVFFSSQCKSMIGYEDHEIGCNPSEWKSRVHPDDVGRTVEDLHKHLRGEIRFYKKEYRMMCKDGSYKWMQSRGKVVRHAFDGRPLRFIGTLTDITERKRVEALKEEFNRMMRHDLRSPLLGIVGLPDILLESKNLTPRECEILSMIQESGYKMLSMINNSLNLHKMELGSYALQSKNVNIVPLFMKAMPGLLRQFRHKNIECMLTIDRQEATNKDVFLVECEELLFYSMISNLFLNAVEASPPGEKVHIALLTPSQSLVIVNKGEVPFEIRESFFEKYVTAGKRDGTGLGTYSAALIAKTHGWKMHLDSSVPGETTVTVEFACRVP